MLVAAGELRRPNGDPFINIDDNWVWIQETAAKAGRWLGYVPWHAIKDERNEPPEIYVPVALPPAPYAHLSFDLHLGLPSADWCRPSVYVGGFNGRQPNRLVLLGEKTSLGDVLRPIARSYGAMLVLATGEFSDTLITRSLRVRPRTDGHRHLLLCRLRSGRPSDVNQRRSQAAGPP